MENKVVYPKLFSVVLRIDINYTLTCIKTKGCTDVCIILKNPLTTHVYLQVMCCPMYAVPAVIVYCAVLSVVFHVGSY